MRACIVVGPRVTEDKALLSLHHRSHRVPKDTHTLQESKCRFEKLSWRIQRTCITPVFAFWLATGKGSDRAIAHRTTPTVKRQMPMCMTACVLRQTRSRCRYSCEDVYQRRHHFCSIRIANFIPFPSSPLLQAAATKQVLIQLPRRRNSSPA